MHGVVHGKRLAVLAVVTLLSFVSVGALTGTWSVALVVHIVLGVGVFPLLTAMMIHFTSVLTRSRQAEGLVAWLPVLAMVVGLMAVLTVGFDRRIGLVGAPLGLLIGLILLAWMHKCARQALGGVHPGLRWYQGSAMFLVVAMLAMEVGLQLPERWLVLRGVHLHCNLLGFLGMAAVGTLQVLLPTVGGYTDADSGRRLQLDYKYAVMGTLGAAVGAAWFRPLSLVGLACWLIPVVHLAVSVLRHRPRIWFEGGGLFPLFGALLGYLSLMLSGLPVALGWMDPARMVPLFFMAFLFPLVTGALGYLLPLWLRQGDGSAGFHARDRQVLARGSRWRTLIFLGSGVAMAAGEGWSVYLAVVGLVWFVVQVMVVVISESRSLGRNAV
ncbi:MAG: hypothetical protein HQL63_03395 [Magnetococcales bacterium]|nr:hypothetical protein [Magnetococcales bacterium]MBF0322202.1 hypothetical protein [Magnetococcales bacterium]